MKRVMPIFMLFYINALSQNPVKTNLLGDTLTYLYVKSDTNLISFFKTTFYFNDSVFCKITKSDTLLFYQEYYNNGIYGQGRYKEQKKEGIWAYFYNERQVLNIYYTQGRIYNYILMDYINNKYIRAISVPGF